MHRRQPSKRRGPRWARLLGLMTLGLLVLAGASRSHAFASPTFDLVGYGGVAAGAPAATGVGPTTAQAVEARTKKTFPIGGGVTGLYPGKVLPLVLTVTNTKHVAITVTSISTVVSGASSQCGAVNVQVTSFSGDLHVKAKGKATTTVEVSMAHSAPDACQGAHFPFQYLGVAKAS
jgi:hypothetical protein